jgi:hypothetical protein
MDAASEAAQAQTTSGKAYGVDQWINVTLPPLTKVWQGFGGSSSFFISEHDVREATGAYVDSIPYHFAETLWRHAQVGASPTRGYRDEIREYVVDMKCAAALALCSANARFGGGGALQYYIPNWERYLYATGRTFTFGAKSY